MKLNVQVIKNYKEYSAAMEKYIGEPLLYDKPELEVGLIEMHIPLDTVEGFKRTEENIVIMSRNEEYVIPFNEEIYNDLKEYIELLDQDYLSKFE